jgi:hypothetical protein
MPTFFAGNILPPEAERTSQDRTFRFSKQDADNLKLVGKPIRLEHNEHLTCGKIVKQMKDRRGRVYVVGKIEDDKADAPKRAVRLFADKALGGLYNSLSLQHVHEENVDGSNAKKTAIEVSLVNEPRRKNCNINCVRRHHAASAKSIGEVAANSKNQEYIGDASEPTDSDARLLSVTRSVSSPAIMAEPTDSPVATPAEAKPAEAPAEPSAPAAAPVAAQNDAAAASGKKDGDVVMEDVIHTIVAQESELDKLKAQLARVEEERAKLAAAEDERTKVAKQAAEKKRKADTDKATALFETVSSLWDEQVTDDLWSDENSRAEQKEKMKQLIAAQPELSKDLFKIVHCASARYAEVLNGDAQRQRELTSKLGHVMKKRKTVHAASARNAPAEPAAPAASAPARGATSKKTLMDIMNGYGGASGTATSIMQRLYKSQMERSQNMF